MTTATQPSESASSSQPSRSVSRSRAKRQRGCGLAGAFERGRLERREQRWRRRVRPERRGHRRDDAPRLALVARRRLDLDVEREVVAQAIGGDRGEARQRLACERGAVPAAGVEARELAPRQRRRRPVARRRALQRRVVQQERHAVGGELHVALEGAVAVRRADPKRRQRVLGRELAGAAVRDPARKGPVTTRSRDHATRCDVAASNQCSCDGDACRLTMSPTAGYGSVASSRAVKSVSPSRP